jgi:hypothetical protein
VPPVDAFVLNLLPPHPHRSFSCSSAPTSAPRLPVRPRSPFPRRVKRIFFPTLIHCFPVVRGAITFSLFLLGGMQVWFHLHTRRRRRRRHGGGDGWMDGSRILWLSHTIATNNKILVKKSQNVFLRF